MLTIDRATWRNIHPCLDPAAAVFLGHWRRFTAVRKKAML